MTTIRDLSVAALDAQCVKGLAKYGKPLDDAHDLSPLAIADHLIEEQADGLQYAVKLRQMIEGLQEQAPEMEALRADNDALRAENARLKAALAPILELAQSLSVGTHTVEVSTVPPSAPVPLPSPAAAALPQVSEIPAGCITSAQAQQILGIGRSAFSNHKQAGRVTPLGKVRLKGGQWADYYRKEDIQKAAKAIKEEQDARARAIEAQPVKAGPITVYNSHSLGQLLGISVSGVSFAVKAGRLTPREGTGTGSGNPYLFDITDPVAFKANYEAKVQASRVASAQKAGQLRANQARQRREQSPSPTPKPKELYPETPRGQHKALAMAEVQKALALSAPFGLAYHSTAQMWKAVPLGPVEPGWGMALRVEQAEGGEWVGTVPISCRGNWIGRLATEILESLRAQKVVR